MGARQLLFRPRHWPLGPLLSDKRLYDVLFVDVVERDPLLDGEVSKNLDELRCGPRGMGSMVRDRISANALRRPVHRLQMMIVDYLLWRTCPSRKPLVLDIVDRISGGKRQAVRSRFRALMKEGLHPLAQH